MRFSLIAKMSSIQVVLGLVASLNFKIDQLDAKSTFLHGAIQEDIYID